MPPSLGAYGLGENFDNALTVDTDVCRYGANGVCLAASGNEREYLPLEVVNVTVLICNLEGIIGVRLRCCLNQNLAGVSAISDHFEGCFRLVIGALEVNGAALTKGVIRNIRYISNR